jgi:hypothetical protein
MNIVNGRFENDIDLAICIFPSDLLKHKELSEIMVDYTTFYAHRIRQISSKLDILYSDSIDSGLEKHSNYKHILFMAAGVRIYDASIILDIVEEIKSHPKYLAAGHILEWKDKWYELHHQFILVNTDSWRLINKPKFGDWSTKEEELVVIERSTENFHDDYTPLWIKDSGKRKIQKHCKQGWNFIEQALRNNLEIINWTQEIRNKRTYYYPETNSNEFYLSYINRKLYPTINNFNQKRLINEMIEGVSHQIWALNSEHMYIHNADKQYEIVALPASGFKYLDVFKSSALTKNGEIVIYDFNQLSLDWIQHIYKSESVEIDHLVRTFNYKDNLKWFGNNSLIIHKNKLSGNFINSFLITVEYFGGINNFIEYLQQFRQTKVTFIKTDLIQNPFNLLNYIDSKKTLLQISNIFSTDFLIGLKGLRKSTDLFNEFVGILHPNTKIIGHSPTGDFIK